MMSVAANAAYDDRLDDLSRDRQRLGPGAALHRARERSQGDEERQDREREVPRVDEQHRARAALLLLSSSLAVTEFATRR